MINSDQGLRAARQGRAIHKWVAEGTVTGSYVVQTAAAMYFNIPVGQQVIVCSMHIGCDTADEFAGAYVVACSEVAGGGTPTQMHEGSHDHVGSKKEGHGHSEDVILPPLCIKYSDGHRSVSLAVKATDTNTVVDYGWSGWVEDEGTLS